jgi:uncharacterized protein (DUF488 family)
LRALVILSIVSVTEIYILFLNVLQVLAINVPVDMQMSCDSATVRLTDNSGV